MRSLLSSFFEGLFIAAPYLLVLFVVLETYLAITAPTTYLAIFHAFAACFNGLVLYYHQTRGNI